MALPAHLDCTRLCSSAKQGRPWLALAVWLSAYALTAAGAQPLAVFETHEHLGRDWPRTLVTYEHEFPVGAIRNSVTHFVNAAGREEPCQLWRVKKHPDGSIASARISFLAELARSQSYRFELVPGKAAAGAHQPVVTLGDEFTTLDNGLVALRLPKAGEFRLDPPVAMSTDHATMVAAYGRQTTKGIAPGPIQGVRLADERWVGGSYFFAAKPDAAPEVTGYTCRITEEGSLFTEAVVRYTFTGGGWYEFTARVLADDPAIRVDEQFDMGPPGSMWDYRLMVSLTGGWKKDGWKPDAAYWISPERRLKGENADFAGKLREIGLTNAPDCASTSILYDEPFKHLFDLAVRYPWHPNAYFFGLVNTVELTRERLASGRIPFLAVVPMHAGNWRGSIDPMDGMLLSHRLGDVCLNWRLRASPHPRTMLHTGEYDPDQPLTFCRRQWALLAGGFQPFEQLWRFRAEQGCVTLDDYKDWALDWPMDPQVVYPRLLFGKADVERLKPLLNQLPAGDDFRRYLYVNDTAARRAELWNRLTSNSEWSGPSGEARHLLSKGDPSNIPWAIGYRVSQMTGWAGDMDELLSSDQLTPEQRARLRRDLAALCYTLTEPDVNPRGCMTHLGNPNMPINRFCGLAWAAALIPDHPMSQTWLDLAAKYIRYKLAMMTAPGGTWGELITYFQASAPHLMQTAGVLARTGRMDESTARLAVAPAQFTMNLLTPPDPRFGARIVPGWGHEGLDFCCHYLVAANAVRPYDPKLAAGFAWAWDVAGKPLSGHHDAGFSPRAHANADLLNTLPAGYIPPQLASAWLPGFGATLRAHAGDPLEVMLQLHQGYQVSHCDANQGDFTLYAKGAPLVALSLDAYAIHDNKPLAQLCQAFGFHSRVRFGSMTNTGGWPGGGAVGGVPAHAFGESVDYVRAIGDYGPQRWTRQISFLKSKTPTGPSYFVFRDSFTAAGDESKPLEPKWWYLRTLGRKDRVKTNSSGFTFTSEFGPKLEAHFLQPAKVAIESREATQGTPLYAGNAQNWRRVHPNANRDGNINIAETITVNAVGPVPPRQDILAILVPLSNEEAPLRSESLADGAARITTREATDYVFLSEKPFRSAGDGIAFEGRAGAVRVYPNEVHLVIDEGPAAISYRGTTLRSAIPAVKVIPKSDLNKRQTIDLPAPWKLKNEALPKGCRLEGPARCELVVANDRLSGRSEGYGGFLYAPMPPGLKVLPMLIIDGQTYAPGTSGETLIIPLMPGEHIFEVRALEQPPIFRNWQAW